jgi:type II secretion system protein G
MQRRRAAGFTLIELLIVVAIIAIIAAISTIAYLSAIERARQKRTVNDMRIVASAWEARATETSTYSAAGYTFPQTAVSYDTLLSALTPTYAKKLPRMDAWGHPLEFALGESPREYAIRSYGRDGAADGSEYTPGDTTEPDCDIVYANGAFVTFPVSVKK